MLISRKKIWVIPTLVLLILGIVLLIYGVVSTSWIHVDCDNRGIEIGMWRMCLNSLEMGTSEEHRQGHGTEQVERNWTETSQICNIILLGRGIDIPQWLASIQLLTMLGVGSVIITTVLAVFYLFIKSKEEIAIGIAAVCLCSGTFIFIALFNAASHAYIHKGDVSKNVAIQSLIKNIFDITCEQFSDASSVSITLLWGGTACIFLAGGLAIAASCFLESGLGAIKQQGQSGYSSREDVLYSLVEDNQAYMYSSSEEEEDSEYSQSSNNVSRKQSFQIKHETGTSKSTA